MKVIKLVAQFTEDKRYVRVMLDGWVIAKYEGDDAPMRANIAGQVALQTLRALNLEGAYDDFIPGWR